MFGYAQTAARSHCTGVSIDTEIEKQLGTGKLTETLIDKETVNFDEMQVQITPAATCYNWSPSTPIDQRPAETSTMHHT